MLRLNLSFLAWAIVVFAINSLLLIGTRQLANDMPFLETSLDPQACPQPCWRDIRPGVSTMEQFLAASSQSSYRYSAAAQAGDDGVVDEIQLTLFGDISLGDVMLVLGEPSHAQLRYAAGFSTSQGRGRQILVGGIAYFGDGLVEVTVRRKDATWAFSPDMVVQTIRYFAPNPQGNIIPIDTPRWHGFGTDYARVTALR